MVTNKSEISNEEINQIEVLKKLIENKTQWGNHKNWKNREFIYLSDEIYGQINIKISSTTLKRLFGKIESKYLPNVSTLDVLANYLEYKDWKDLIKKNHDSIQKLSKGKEIKNVKKISIQSKKIILYSLSSLVLFTLIYLLLINIDRPLNLKKVNPSEVSFKCSNPIGVVPHNIKFNYSISNLKGHLVEIHLKGMGAKPIIIDLGIRGYDNRFYNFTVDNPGIYEALLVVDGKVLFKEKCIIKTKGWQLLIDGSGKDIRYKNFIAEDSIINEGKLWFSPEKASELGYKINSFNPSFIFVDNVLTQLNEKDFSMEMRFKLPSNVGSDACKRVFFTLLTRESFISFGITSKGCSPTNRIYLPGIEYSGETKDMSKLEVNENDWNDMLIKVRENTFSLYLNNNLCYELTYKGSLGEIGGVKMHYFGFGMIDNIYFYNENKEVIYSNNFD